MGVWGYGSVEGYPSILSYPHTFLEVISYKHLAGKLLDFVFHL